MDQENKTNVGRKKNLPKEFLKMSWDPVPGKPNDHKIAKLIKLTDKNDGLKLKNMPPTDVKPNMSEIHVWDKTKWVCVGKRCLDCGKVMKSNLVIERHPSICTHGLLINKQEEHEILKRIKKDNK